jgi:benzoyl-CoA reductase/2-hydroxyglutaryl-CoA dehydratase subunit BcrC/BadD/HgdB
MSKKLPTTEIKILISNYRTGTSALRELYNLAVFHPQSISSTELLPKAFVELNQLHNQTAVDLKRASDRLKKLHSLESVGVAQYQERALLKEISLLESFVRRSSYCLSYIKEVLAFWRSAMQLN